MSTAVFAPNFVGSAPNSSKVSLLAKRFVNALVASRVKRVELELRRREALLNDLGRRQDHSPLFLSQDEFLPFKI